MGLLGLENSAKAAMRIRSGSLCCGKNRSDRCNLHRSNKTALAPNTANSGLVNFLICESP